MPFVGEPYRHDVFLTYAHGDPGATQRSPLATWSRRFADLLIGDIQAVDPSFDSLDLFQDKDLDRTLPLASQLQEKVRESALLLIVMSPRYLQS